MRRGYLAILLGVAILLVGSSLFASRVAAAGVNICSINYDCSCASADGVCPTTFGAVCPGGDKDCGTCPVTCGNGRLDNGEACDPSIDPCCAADCSGPLSAGVVCRGATACEGAGMCDGSSVSCPDAFLSAGTPCGSPSSYTCDVTTPSCGRSASYATSCTGASSLCIGPPVQLRDTAPANTECSNGAYGPGVCTGSPCGDGRLELGEVCDPSIDACCAADCSGPKSAGTVCRSATACESAGLCDGATFTCPAAFIPGGTPCVSPTSYTCDPGPLSCGRTGSFTASCTGADSTCSGPATQVHDDAPAGTQCSGGVFVPGTCTGAKCGNGVRDQGEACDPGIDPCCAADCTGPLTVGTVCRGATACESAGVCDGTSFSCADAFIPAGTPCVPVSSYSCDGGPLSCGRTGTYTNTCTGASASCSGPATQVHDIAPANTQCSNGVYVFGTCTGSLCGNGQLDQGEVCDYLGNPCCKNDCSGYKSAGTVCRAAAGFCDAAETCTGSSASCPADAFAPATAKCDTGSWVCTDSCDRSQVDTYCPGTGPDCSGSTVLSTDKAQTGQSCSGGAYVAGSCGLDVCGDGIAGPTEVCDGNDLKGRSCGADGGIGSYSCIAAGQPNQCHMTGCYWPPPHICTNPSEDPSCPPRPCPDPSDPTCDVQCLAGSAVSNGHCCTIGTVWNAGANACIAGVENSPSLCTNSVDDDADALVDWNDITPDVNLGSSCNVCDVTACQMLDPSNVPHTWWSSTQPPDAGTLFTNGTSARPGNGANLRMDYDGKSQPGSCWCAQCDAGSGYAWDAGNNKCAKTLPPPCGTTSVVIDSFTATLTGPTAPGSAILTAGYTVTADYPTNVSIEFDTDGNTAAYEVKDATNMNGSDTDPTSVAGLAAGVHPFNVRVTATCVGGTKVAVSGPVSVTVVAPTPPSIGLFAPVVTPDWLASNVSFFIQFTHGAQTSLTLFDGDGAQYGPTLFPAGLQTPTVFHQFTGLAVGEARSVTAVLNVTDNTDPSLSTQVSKTFTIYALNYTPGDPKGNKTDPPLLPGSCAPDSCPILGPGNVYYCVSQFACFPDNKTICIPPNVPVSRDFSQAACEYSSSTCQAFTWANITQSSWPVAACCGNDANEFPATSVFDPANPSGAACCAAAGMCYTSVGNAPGCVVPGGENTPAQCGDGIDNNCNGLVDAADPGCAAQTLNGTVELHTSQGYVAAVGAKVTIGDISTSALLDQRSGQAVYSFSQSNQAAALQPGVRLVTASLFGYTTETQQLTLVPGGTYSLNFTLEPRLCNDDCTNKDGYCDSSCIGVGRCQPTAPEIQTMQACHPAGAPYGLRPGQEVILDYNPTTSEALVGLCCAIPPSWRSAPKSAVAPNPTFGRIDTLVKYTTTVIINGRPYKFVVNSW